MTAEEMAARLYKMPRFVPGVREPTFEVGVHALCEAALAVGPLLTHEFPDWGDSSIELFAPEDMTGDDLFDRWKEARAARARLVELGLLEDGA